MAKGFFSSAKTYTKNLGIQTGRVLTGQANLSDAGKQLGSDTRKLVQSVGASSKDYHPESKELVDKARKCYNEKQYEKAEENFRMALVFDDKNPWAYCYLGNTYYKQGRRDEALTCWRRAIELEPGSKAAEKARSGIDVVERSQAKVTSELLARVTRKRS